MAKSRYVNTKFWMDDYISNLDPIEKLLFLYFLTNPATDISGVYELPVKNIALDTGIDKEMVIKIMKRFQKDKKIFFEDGWVAIKNFAKHQNLNNKQIFAGVEAGLNRAPQSLKDKLADKSLGVIQESSYLIQSNLIKSNLIQLNSGDDKSSQISEVIDLFKDVNPSYKKWFSNKTQRLAVTRLLEIHGLAQLQKVIAFLPKSNRTSYMPTITTPLQLEDKWASLESNLIKKKVESGGKGRGLA